MDSKETKDFLITIMTENIDDNKQKITLLTQKKQILEEKMKTLEEKIQKLHPLEIKMILEMEIKKLKDKNAFFAKLKMKSTNCN